MKEQELTLPLSTMGLSILALSATYASAQIAFDPLARFQVTSSGYAGDIACGDLNGDGLPDVVMEHSEDGYQRTFRIAFNDGTGGIRLGYLLETEPLNYYGKSNLTIADINGDYKNDVLWVLGPGTLSAFINSGDGRHGQIVAYPTDEGHIMDVDVADLNGDGLPDVAIVINDDSGWHVEVLFNQGHNQFDSRDVYAADSGGKIPQCVTGDIDGDGDNDIMVLEANLSYGKYGYDGNQILVQLRNDGTGQFNDYRHWTERVSEKPVDIAMGDFDRDGDLDFAVLRTLDLCSYCDIYGELTIYRNDGAGITPTFDEDDLPLQTDGNLFIADFDLDGRPDVAVCPHKYGGYLQTFQGLGGSHFAPGKVQYRSPRNTTLKGVALFPEPMSGHWGFALAGNDTYNSGPGYIGTLQNHSTFGDLPSLAVSQLTRGGDAQFSVTNAHPDEEVYFLYTLDGPGNGPSEPDFGNLVIDLTGGITELGSAVADANGNAQLQVHVSEHAPLANLTVQALINRGNEGADSVKSPFLTRHIQP